VSGGGDGELIKLQGTFVFSQPPAFSEVPRVGESGDPRWSCSFLRRLTIATANNWKALPSQLTPQEILPEQMTLVGKQAPLAVRVFWCCSVGNDLAPEANPG
jgi:hypothetical protein